MLGLAETFLYFLAYSIFGWAFESFCCLAMAKKPVSRGFLIGPWCPIYGLGGIALAAFLRDFTLPPVITWLGMILICTLVEYLSSVILEKLFKIRWWDYSDMPFNLNGRVCLWASLMFGIIGWFVLFVLKPWFAGVLAGFTPDNICLIAGVLAVIFALDVLISGSLTIKFSKQHQGRKRSDNTGEVKKYIRERILKFLG